MTSAYVAQKYLEEFDKNPKWEVQGIHHVRKDIIVELTNSQTYRAKRKAREMLDGDERLEYAKLREYAEMIRSTNKGSHVILETEILDKGDERPIFNRMYIIVTTQGKRQPHLHLYPKRTSQVTIEAPCNC